MNVTVTLSPELEEFVNSQVRSGLYPTVDDVLREGLVLLRARDELRGQSQDELRREIALAIQEVEQGKLSTLTAREILAQERQRGKESDRE